MKTFGSSIGDEVKKLKELTHSVAKSCDHEKIRNYCVGKPGEEVGGAGCNPVLPEATGGRKAGDV
ncbi:MAG: hypothetical protein CME31_10055 [Gimesia sp.]|uniref:Uncharacterized protein n=1 Tax=Gimesia maris TaxID=122 RepID=A0A3D3R8T0_9PLAN|nr:hypothetical protein [Gimesia sp.]HCO25284.1 hypothetical protein [Gimesia maris]